MSHFRAGHDRGQRIRTAREGVWTTDLPSGQASRQHEGDLVRPSTWTRYRAAHRRDAAATTAMFGFFAAGWFGWAQTPPTWQAPLVAGSLLAVAAALVGALLTWRYRGAGTALDDPRANRAFGIVVGVEVILAALGIPVLAAVHRPELMPAWVGVVVGLHLFPLARLFSYPLLSITGAVVTALSVAAVPLAQAGSVSVSVVACAATGTTLLAAAAMSLVWSLRPGPDKRTASRLDDRSTTAGR